MNVKSTDTPGIFFKEVRSMRKLILSVFLAVCALAISIGPVLADSIGPTP